MPNRTILFVDDNADIQTVMSIGLAHFGHQIVTASDASSTLAALDKLHFDLLILDNGLPGIDGIDLGAQILQRPELAKLPIVLFTGTRDHELEAQAKSFGFVDCWVKPMGLHLINRKIEALFESRDGS